MARPSSVTTGGRQNRRWVHYRSRVAASNRTSVEVGPRASVLAAHHAADRRCRSIVDDRTSAVSSLRLDTEGPRSRGPAALRSSSGCGVGVHAIWPKVRASRNWHVDRGRVARITAERQSPQPPGRYRTISSANRRTPSQAEPSSGRRWPLGSGGTRESWSAHASARGPSRTDVTAVWGDGQMKATSTTPARRPGQGNTECCAQIEFGCRADHSVVATINGEIQRKRYHQITNREIGYT